MSLAATQAEIRKNDSVNNILLKTRPSMNKREFTYFW